MPRSVSKSVPKYRKHRASGQAIVTLSGVDHYLGPHGTKASKVQYDRLVGEWLQNGRTSAVDDEDSLTVVELCALYWKFAEKHYRKDGRSTRVTPGIKRALSYLKQWYGKEAADSFGPLALKAIRQRMVEEGLSRTYVNDHIGRIKRLYRWAAGEELVSPSVPQALSMVAGLRRGRSEARETAPVMAVDDSVIEATLEHLPEVVGDMVRFQRATGCRPNEVCQLRPCDLDRTEDVWTYKPRSHKTEHHGKARVVFCGPKAQAVLLKYLARDPEAFCFQPRDSEAKRQAAKHAARVTPLSCGNTPGSNRRKKPKVKAGETYTADSFRRAIHRVCEKHGIEKWAPNRLRHTAATQIRREFGLEAAQVILGHSAADVTQVYAERDMAKGAEVARRIG